MATASPGPVPPPGPSSTEPLIVCESVVRIRLAARESGELPVLVTGGEGWEDVLLRWGDDSVTIRSIGDAPSLPAQLNGRALAVVVDRHLLAAAIGHDVPATQAWVVGPEAGTRLDDALAGTESKVVTRAGWLAQWAAAPVTRALGWLFVGASGVATALAALAVALMAASGAAERTRAGAQIRVLGTPRSEVARVAWLEATIPAVLASAVGIAAGIGLAGLLVAALDLPSVTGGLRVPRLVIPWWSLAIPVALGGVARMAVAVAGWRHTDKPLGPMMRAS
ncbi:MAG: FtsX-like permease family protein [Propionicimonas sp.]